MQKQKQPDHSVGNDNDMVHDNDNDNDNSQSTANHRRVPQKQGSTAFHITDAVRLMLFPPQPTPCLQPRWRLCP